MGNLRLQNRSLNRNLSNWVTSYIAHDGRFQPRSRDCRDRRLRHRLHLQHLPPRQLPASRRREPGLLPQIRRRLRPLHRHDLDSHVTGGRGESARLSARYLQRSLQSHIAHEGAMACRLHRGRYPRLLCHPLRNVFL